MRSFGDFIVRQRFREPTPHIDNIQLMSILYISKRISENGYKVLEFFSFGGVFGGGGNSPYIDNIQCMSIVIVHSKILVTEYLKSVDKFLRYLMHTQ